MANRILNLSWRQFARSLSPLWIAHAAFVLVVMTVRQGLLLFVPVIPVRLLLWDDALDRRLPRDSSHRACQDCSPRWRGESCRRSRTASRVRCRSLTPHKLPPLSETCPKDPPRRTRRTRRRTRGNAEPAESAETLNAAGLPRQAGQPQAVHRQTNDSIVRCGSFV